jgi:hypothetical protein
LVPLSVQQKAFSSGRRNTIEVQKTLVSTKSSHFDLFPAFVLFPDFSAFDMTTLTGATVAERTYRHKISETTRSKISVPDGALDWAMAQIALQCPGVRSFVRENEHVGVNLKRHLRSHTGALAAAMRFCGSNRELLEDTQRMIELGESIYREAIMLGGSSRKWPAGAEIGGVDVRFATSSRHAPALLDHIRNRRARVPASAICRRLTAGGQRRRPPRARVDSQRVWSTEHPGPLARPAAHVKSSENLSGPSKSRATASRLACSV